LRMTAGRRGERKTQISSLQWRLLRRWLDAHTPKATTLPNTAEHCGPCGNRRRPRKRCIC
jgi:hypothetical protein